MRPRIVGRAGDRLAKTDLFSPGEPLPFSRRSHKKPLDTFRLPVGGRGAGRRPLAPEKRQRNRIMVSFTDAELATLTNAVGGEPISTFLHDFVVESLRRRLR